MTIRTQLKPGRVVRNHNEGLQVRSTIKAGGVEGQHNEALRVRTTLKAGGHNLNHNETVRRDSDRPVSMLRQPRTTGPKDHRLVLLFVRANLRAGRARNLVGGRGRR